MSGRSAASGLWRSLAGGSVFTGWAWIVTFPFDVIMLGGYADAHTGIERAIGIGIAIAVHALGGIVMLGGAVIERTARSDAERSFRVLLVLVALGAARPLAIDLLQGALGVRLYDGPMAARIATNVIFSVVAMTLVAMLVQSIRRHAGVRSRLQAVRGAIESERQDDERALEAVTRIQLAEAAAAVREALVRDRHGRFDADAEAAALRRVSEEVVRPLSHRMFLGDDGGKAPVFGGDTASASEETPQLPPVFDAGRLRTDRDGFAGLVIRPATPWIPPALYLVLVLPYLVAQFGLPAASAISAVGLVAIVAGNLVVQRWNPGGGRMPQLAALALGYTGVGAVAAGVTELLARIGGWDWPFFLGDVLAYPVVALFVAACESALRRLGEVETRLVAALAEEDRLAARAHERLAFAQAGVARLLHSGVQGELVATAMRLRRGEADAHDVDAALARVERLLTEPAPVAPVTAAAIEDRTDRLLRAWRMAIGIEFAADPAVWHLLAADRARAELALDALSEALTNVVRHADRPRAQVRLWSEAPGAASIEVRSPGRVPGEGAPGGLGHGLADLRRRAAAVSLRQDGAEVVLTVTLAA